MSFIYPQALLLLAPLLLWLWRSARVSPLPMAVRVGLVVALTLALARPQLALRSAGADVVVVVDRSRSMPPKAEGSALELIRLLEGQRRPADRLGVISFGKAARVDMPLSATASFGGFAAGVDPDASNLAVALDAAGDLVPLERAARVLVISDGKTTGLDVRAAARRLGARGIAVDYRFVARDDVGLDVAVTSLEVPAAVSAKEPFQVTAQLTATRATEATLTLSRQGKPVLKAKRALAAGSTTVTLPDLIDTPGLSAYQLTVEAPADAQVENDVGRAVVRVDGPPKVLLLTDHPQGTLAQTLVASGVDCAVARPGPLTMNELDGIGALVLEDVEAGRLGEQGIQVAAQFVTQAGGGLVMTGGRHSFAEGGYRRSSLEDVLPVSLEVRQEQRKAAVAISIIMDCSCSMGATVPDGRTKMQLAAEGVVGALQLLNARDEASVHMVDTGSHQIFGLSPVVDGLPLDKVARGFSGGGGIYIGEGLRTAKREILSSSKPTRHVLLFADAADSEEPDDYRSTLTELQKEHVTVSVIGMGSPRDSDAALLQEVAALGGGRMYFAEDVTSLPRIFSQETVAVARSSFVDQTVGLAVAPDLSLLGRSWVQEVPAAGGYSLTYVKPQANVGLRTVDENRAPALAFWSHGAGRAVALTLEVDGKYTGAMRQWPGQRALLERAVRWAMPAEEGRLDVQARSTLVGDDLHVTLDFDPAGPAPAVAPTLVMLSADAAQPPLSLPMQWEEEGRAGAHFTVSGAGTWHPVVKLKERTVRAPPVALSYAPEFEPRSAAAGHAELAAAAAVTGGLERLSMVGLFVDAPQSVGAVPLAPVLVSLALVMLLTEVVLRRVLAGRVRVAKVSQRVVVLTPAPPGLPDTKPARLSETPKVEGAPSGSVVERPMPPVEPVAGVAAALEAARARAKRRTGR